MKLTITAFFAAILLACSAAPARADEASKNAKIEEMMLLTHADQMTAQLFDQMKTMLASQMAKIDVPAEARPHLEEMQQKMINMIADRMSWEKSKATYIKIYAETFSESDIDGILAFYKSPAGRSMLEKMPQLMQKSMLVGQQLMGDVMPEIQRMMEEAKQTDNKKK